MRITVLTITNCKSSSYDDLREYRKLEGISNSPKKVGKCGHVIKDLWTSTTLLGCSTILFDCPEINTRQSKNILRIPYELPTN